MRLAVVSLLAAVTLPIAARAEGFVSGSQLMQACSSSSTMDDRLCTGFIAGAADQVSANPSLKGTLCPVPPGTSLKEIKAALVKYGREHSDKVGQPAVRFLNDAVRDRYPCN